MNNGFAMTSAYTYAKATDWWAGGILIPEYWHLNKGTQGGNTPHKVDISATYELPFGPGRKFASNGGALSHILSGWQVNSYFTAFSGSPFSISASNASLGANSGAARRSGEGRTSKSSAASAWTTRTSIRPRSSRSPKRGSARRGSTRCADPATRTST